MEKVENKRKTSGFINWFVTEGEKRINEGREKQGGKGKKEVRRRKGETKGGTFQTHTAYILAIVLSSHSYICSHWFIISLLQRLRLNIHEFMTRMGYTVRPYLTHIQTHRQTSKTTIIIKIVLSIYTTQGHGTKISPQHQLITFLCGLLFFASWAKI